MALTTSEKIDKAEEQKTKGNDLFKEKRFKKAITIYSRVFAYINGIIDQESPMSQYSSALGVQPPSEDEKAKIRELRITAWSNIAMCHVKLGEGEKALDFCNKVLDVKADHVKALFRKGQAYMLMKNYEKAKDAFKTVVCHDENNTAAMKEIQRLLVFEKKADEKAKKAFTGIFNKLDEDLYSK